MAKKNKKGFNCELWNDRILKENKYFPNREGRKGIEGEGSEKQECVTCS